jgi:hypothetical protein
MLNELAREKLVERGIVGEGHAFRTEDGVRNSPPATRSSSSRTTARSASRTACWRRWSKPRPDGSSPRSARAIIAPVVVEQRFYRNLDHGYATTIHKSQGATVDRVKVLASLSLDRHLTYVAMTRHREDVALYYGKRSFAMKRAACPRSCRGANAKETTLDYSGGRFYRRR